MLIVRNGKGVDTSSSSSSKSITNLEPITSALLSQILLVSQLAPVSANLYHLADSCTSPRTMDVWKASKGSWAATSWGDGCGAESYGFVEIRSMGFIGMKKSLLKKSGRQH